MMSTFELSNDILDNKMIFTSLAEASKFPQCKPKYSYYLLITYFYSQLYSELNINYTLSSQQK